MIHKQFGRWTVIGDAITTARGERKWLCRCTCGTERYVLERSLNSGGSTSCGCLRRENVSEARSLDLNGQVFGELTVLKKCNPKNGRRGIWWLCRCSCGREYEVSGSLLAAGKRTHCKNPVHERQSSYRDISGQRFCQLVALYPVSQTDAKGYRIWHCRCDCGNEVDVSYNNLMYGNQKSCGCRKRNHEQILNTYLTHAAGTSMDMLKSKKLPADNTTGCKGVYLVRGKYMAKIVFQKKQYVLGSYEQYDDAVRARQEAEELLFDSVADHYARWKIRADADPQWAQNNPMQVHVEKKDTGLKVLILPKLEPEESLLTKAAE